MSLRAFIALPVPDDLRDRLVGLQRHIFGGCCDIAAVPRENLHLTLRFLGRLDEEGALAAGRACARAAASCPSFKLAVAGAGAFPGREPRVLWAGLSGGVNAIVALRELLDDALAHEGFPCETQPFRAHITLGRVGSVVRLRELKERIAAAHDFQVGHLEAKEIFLMESRLASPAPRYSALASWPLTGERPVRSLPPEA